LALQVFGEEAGAALVGNRPEAAAVTPSMPSTQDIRVDEIRGGSPDKERSSICRKACEYIRPADGPQGWGHIKPVNTPADTLVLDSNVVLDWLLFRDARAVALARWVTSGRCQWVATQAMQAELELVLTRPQWQSRQSDIAELWTEWHRLVRPVKPRPLALARPLRCTDPDDQKFVDLACQVGASALLSRDRAVLKLARRAAPLGLRICTPEDWSPPA
jgi:predicted nucleic acid-binding protein